MKISSEEQNALVRIGCGYKTAEWDGKQKTDADLQRNTDLFLSKLAAYAENPPHKPKMAQKTLGTLERLKKMVAVVHPSPPPETIEPIESTVSIEVAEPAEPVQTTVTIQTVVQHERSSKPKKSTPSEQLSPALRPLVPDAPIRKRKAAGTVGPKIK